MPFFKKKNAKNSPNSLTNYRIIHKIHRTPPIDACEKGSNCKCHGWHHRSFSPHLVNNKSILQKLGYYTYEYIESI
jgi:hypothetical protein